MSNNVTQDSKIKPVMSHWDITKPDVSNWGVPNHTTQDGDKSTISYLASTPSIKPLGDRAAHIAEFAGRNDFAWSLELRDQDPEDAEVLEGDLVRSFDSSRTGFFSSQGRTPAEMKFGRAAERFRSKMMEELTEAFHGREALNEKAETLRSQIDDLKEQMAPKSNSLLSSSKRYQGSDRSELKSRLKELESELEAVDKEISQFDRTFRKYQPNVNAFINAAQNKLDTLETKQTKIARDADNKARELEELGRRIEAKRNEVGELQHAALAQKPAIESEVARSETPAPSQPNPRIAVLEREIEQLIATHRTKDQARSELNQQLDEVGHQLYDARGELRNWARFQYRPDLEAILVEAKALEFNSRRAEVTLNFGDRLEAAKKSALINAVEKTLGYFKNEILTILNDAGVYAENQLDDIITEALNAIMDEEFDIADTSRTVQSFIAKMLDTAKVALETNRQWSKELEGEEEDQEDFDRTSVNEIHFTKRLDQREHRQISLMAATSKHSLREVDAMNDGDASVSENSQSLSKAESAVDNSQFIERLKPLATDELFRKVFSKEASTNGNREMQLLKEAQQALLSRFIQLRTHSVSGKEAKDAERVQFTDMIAKSTADFMENLAPTFVNDKGEPAFEMKRVTIIYNFVREATHFLDMYALRHPAKPALSSSLPTEKAYMAAPTGVEKAYDDATDAADDSINRLQTTLYETLEKAKEEVAKKPAHSLEEYKARSARLVEMQEATDALLSSMYDQIDRTQMYFTFQAALNKKGEAFAAEFAANWAKAVEGSVSKMLEAHAASMKKFVSDPLLAADAKKPLATPADFKVAPSSEEAAEETGRNLLVPGVERAPNFAKYSEDAQYYVGRLLGQSNNAFKEVVGDIEERVAHLAAQKIEIEENAQAERLSRESQIVQIEARILEIAQSRDEVQSPEEATRQLEIEKAFHQKQIEKSAKRTEKRLAEIEETLKDLAKQQEVTSLVLANKLRAIEIEALGLIDALEGENEGLSGIIGFAMEQITNLTKTLDREIYQLETELATVKAKDSTQAEKVSFLGKEGDKTPGLHRVAGFDQYSKDQQTAILKMIELSNKAYNSAEEEDFDEEASVVLARGDLEQELVQKQLEMLEAATLPLIAGAQGPSELKKIVQEFEAKLPLIEKVLELQANAIKTLEEKLMTASRTAQKEVERLNKAAHEKAMSQEPGTPVQRQHYDSRALAAGLRAIEAEAREMIENVSVMTLARAAAPAPASANKSTSTETQSAEEFLNDVQGENEGEEEGAPIQPIALRLTSGLALGEILKGVDGKIGELMRSLDKAPPADNGLEKLAKNAAQTEIKISPMIDEALKMTTPTMYERAYTWLTDFDTSNIGDIVLKVLAWITLIFPIIVFTAMAAMHSLVWKPEVEVLRGQITRGPVHGIKS